MTADAQPSDGPTPWLRRTFEATGQPAWRIGVALALFGALAFGAQELLLGRFRLAASDPNVLDNMRVAVTHIVITAYLLTAYVVAQRSTEQTVHDLLPHLDPGAVADRLEPSPADRTALRASVVAGVVIFLVINFTISPGEVSMLPTRWTPEEAWHRVFGFAMGILTLRLVTLLVLDAGRLSDLAAGLRDLDLVALDTSDATRPFVRQGLTSALLVVGLVSVFALFLVDPRYLPLVSVVVASTLVVAPIALLLPLRGLRIRIIAAKHQELVWCRARLRARRAELASGSGGDAPPLDELVAWEARIQGVREWPVDTSTFTRFVLYLLLPLGSWAGAAVVERFVNALLD